MRRVTFIVALIVVSASPAWAQLGHETELFAYRRAVVALESRNSRMSVEELYRRGLRVRQALLSEKHGVLVIEGLPTDDYEALRRQLVGFVVNREEAIVVSPDPEYFARLARTYGDEGDRAFFAAYAVTRPGGVWPAWSEHQTDSSGCTRFGTGALVSSYRTWVEYQRAYPKRYRDEVEGFIGAIEFELSESTCACDDLTAVARELDEFEKTFPQSRVSERIRSRIMDLREKRSLIRPKCVAG